MEFVSPVGDQGSCGGAPLARLMNACRRWFGASGLADVSPVGDQGSCGGAPLARLMAVASAEYHLNALPVCTDEYGWVRRWFVKSQADF